MNKKTVNDDMAAEFPTSVALIQRDYFAAQAMNGLLAAGRDAQYGSDSVNHLARACFSIADAMMKAREA